MVRAAAYYRHQNGFATALHNAIFQILHSLKPIWIHSKIKGLDVPLGIMILVRYLEIQFAVTDIFSKYITTPTPV